MYLRQADEHNFSHDRLNAYKWIMEIQKADFYLLSKQI